MLFYLALYAMKGVAEKQDELKLCFKHPLPFSSLESGMPHEISG